MFNMNNTGVVSIGVKAPMIVRGDDVKKILIESIEKSKIKLKENDVIGITESVVARSMNNYVTVDDLVFDIGRRLNGVKDIALWSPIMSRNRFSLILRAFARYANRLYIYVNEDVDQQGNPTHGINHFTGVDIQEYYRRICNEENCIVKFYKISRNKKISLWIAKRTAQAFIDAQCHPNITGALNLTDFMNHSYATMDRSSVINGRCIGSNETFGLLGSNKSGDEELKLFPDVKAAQALVNDIKSEVFNKWGVNVDVMIYGDGCFHSPEIPGIPGSSINEFADPVTSPAYTKGLDGCPNEFKIKYIIDTQGAEEAEKLIKQKSKDNLVGKMSSQGTTPRRKVDLLASLMDLTSGSGSRCTPFVIVQNYL